jgi:hypothetical protein
MNISCCSLQDDEEHKDKAKRVTVGMLLTFALNKDGAITITLNRLASTACPISTISEQRDTTMSLRVVR